LFKSAISIIQSLSMEVTHANCEIWCISLMLLSRFSPKGPGQLVTSILNQHLPESVSKLELAMTGYWVSFINNCVIFWILYIHTGRFL